MANSKSSKSIINESQYEGLLSSMRHARNRYIFFILFITYCLLSILGTTDKMLFMETAIKMPLLNIELPLLAFYAVMPLFILVLYFNLLYTFHSHRTLIEKTKKFNKAAFKILPTGIYEGALFKKNGFHRILQFSVQLFLYVFPVLVLIGFWFRFSDYQSPMMSLWHIIAINISILFGFYFRGLSRFNKNKPYFSVSIINLITIIGLLSYHILVIHPFSKALVNLDDLDSLANFERKIESKMDGLFKRNEWFLPRLIVRGEILLSFDNVELDILQEINGINENKEILTSLPSQDRTKRNFRLAILDSCILSKVNFKESQFQHASLNFVQLQGANMERTQFQGASFWNGQLQGVNLSNSQLQKAFLGEEILLQGARLDDAILHGADLWGANLQGASLTNTQLQKAKLYDAQLQGANLFNAQLQGASLLRSKLHGADLRYAELQGAELTEVEFQGADLRSAQFQGAFGYIRPKGKLLFKSGKKQTDFDKFINSEILTQEEATELISSLEPYFASTSELDFKKFKKNQKYHINRAIGIKPIDWIQNQEGVSFGLLNEELDKILKKSLTRVPRINLHQNKTYSK